LLFYNLKLSSINFNLPPTLFHGRPDDNCPKNILQSLCQVRIFDHALIGARRGLSRDVHDGRPEEVLRRHEEDGQQEAGQGDAKAEGTAPEPFAQALILIRVTRGRCYDHIFSRFSTIFCGKMAFFSKTNCMIKILHNLALF
jgi:hypothetical protein